MCAHVCVCMYYWCGNGDGNGNDMYTVMYVGVLLVVLTSQQFLGAIMLLVGLLFVLFSNYLVRVNNVVLCDVI